MLLYFNKCIFNFLYQVPILTWFKKENTTIHSYTETSIYKYFSGKFIRGKFIREFII